MAEGRIFLGIEEFLAARCLCCGTAEANARHERLCHRSATQVTSTNPWCTRSPARSRVFPFVTKWKVEPTSTQTAISACTWLPRLPRREDSEMLRHRSAATKRYFSTSRMRTHNREPTCGQAAPTQTDQPLPLVRRASAIITLVRDRCASTRAATNSPLSR